MTTDETKHNSGGATMPQKFAADMIWGRSRRACCAVHFRTTKFESGHNKHKNPPAKQLFPPFEP